MNRRSFIRLASALPFLAGLPLAAQAEDSAAFARLKSGYAQRLKNILTAGGLPYIDIESSCNSAKIDIDALAEGMDKLGIGLMALSADLKENSFNQGIRYDALAARLIADYPDRFIPVGNGGQPPAMTVAPDEFLDAQEEAARNRKILLYGEFEFRHYPSPRELKRSGQERDVKIPIDGPTGHHLFAMSERTGLAFQIHYEIEDALLGPLEAMLTRYPKAKVIWCHLAQIRYIERASKYSPDYVASLIGRFPNLHFDTAFGNAASVYPLSQQHHARVWAADGSLKPEWRDLIAAHPERFMSALDLGQDRIERLAEYDRNHRAFLQQLPVETRHQVAYRSAWRLLFDEEFIY
jgi:hypothetical protein